METVVETEGNDSSDTGVVTITYNRAAERSPLHLDFVRKDGFKASISLTRSGANDLFRVLAENSKMR